MTPAQVERIARVCHAANKAWNDSMGEETLPYEVVGKGVEQGVRNIEEGKVNRPYESHEAWLRDRIRDGWTHGPVKDAEKKTHPALVPFEDLPPDQQVKDYLFFGIVQALMPSV